MRNGRIVEVVTKHTSVDSYKMVSIEIPLSSSEFTRTIKFVSSDVKMVLSKYGVHVFRVNRVRGGYFKIAIKKSGDRYSNQVMLFPTEVSNGLLLQTDENICQERWKFIYDTLVNHTM